ncbi:hypothetical protein AFR_12110 [Actinoplanes friuliensis DSM 7358]|uniref:Uncharacterized protein n=1 Tax=Actinoplanes friuliensis DSM 7358 TaxID=1246995 RepID=U5VUP8_9ACTN|nr:hypothetical protein AFR_12110 [Actinoplanes friuliensis DSM 7358]
MKQRDGHCRWATIIGGDWKFYTHCAMAMGHIGGATADIGSNLLAGTKDVPSVWRCKAAEAEKEFQVALGLAATGLNDACAQYHKRYMQAAEAVKSLVDVTAGMISDLLDLLIIINAAAAAGRALIETSVGAVTGYGVAAYYTWQAGRIAGPVQGLFSRLRISVATRLTGAGRRRPAR